MSSTAMMVIAMVEAWGPALAEFFVSQLNSGKMTPEQFRRILDRANKSDRRFREYVESVKREMGEADAGGNEGSD